MNLIRGEYEGVEQLLSDGLTEQAYNTVFVYASTNIAVAMMFVLPRMQYMQRSAASHSACCILWQQKLHFLMCWDVCCCPGASGCLVGPPGRATAANRQDASAVTVSSISKRALVKAALLLQRKVELQTLLSMLVSLTQFETCVSNVLHLHELSLEHICWVPE